MDVTQFQNTPPAVRVQLDAGEGSYFSALSVTRDGAPVRTQPTLGFRQAACEDFEPPYSVPCTYRAAGTISTPVDEVTLWSEAWPDVSAWSGSNWAASTSKAASSVPGASISRSALGIGRITIEDPSYVRLEFLSATGAVVGSVASTDVTTVAGTSTSVISAVGTFSAQVTANRLIVTGPGDISVPFAGVVASVRLVSLASVVQTASWGTTGEPSSVAVDSAGNVYVTDEMNNRVRKFSSSGGAITSWVCATDSGAAGIAIDSAGNVYVADTFNHLVRKFSSTGATITSWSTGSYPISGDIAIDATGNIYLLDNDGSTVRKFSSTGAAITSWSVTTAGAIAADLTGNIYVLENYGDRVRKYSSTGTLIASWTPGHSSGIGTDSAGNVYVVSESSGTVKKYSPTGVLLLTSSTVGPMWAVAVDSTGAIYAVDREARIVRKLLQKNAEAGPVTTYLPPTVVTSDFDESAVSTIESERAWIINTSNPGLSFPLSMTPGVAALQEIGGRTSDAIDSSARPLGSNLTVFTRQVSARAGHERTIKVLTESADEATALDTCLADQSPILFRFPPGYKMRLKETYYRVGQISEDPLVEAPGFYQRTWTLPLTETTAPNDVVTSSWTFGDLIAQGWTYGDIARIYATYYDLLVDNRRA